MKSRHELGRALLACVADRPDELRRRILAGFDDLEIAQLAIHASRQRVAPLFATAIRSSGTPISDEAQASLLRTHVTRTAAHLRVLSDLDLVQHALSESEIRFLVIKGPIVAEHLYPSADLRTYDDLDVLLAPADFERAIDALRQAGSELLDRNWTLIRADARGQVHLQLPMGTLADVHWHVLNRESVRGGFRIETNELFERARTLHVAGRDVLTMDGVDTLLHLCLHAALSGADRLIWLKDIERAISVDRPAWDDVVERARSWRAGRSVAIALARSRRALGAPAPDDVLDRLFASRAWRAISQFLDRRFPTEESVGRATPAVLWAQLTRDSATATLRALLGRSFRRVRGMAAHGETSPGAIFTSTGTESDERAFLRGVAAEDRRRRAGRGQ
jgi:hypothetical protein